MRFATIVPPVPAPKMIRFFMVVLRFLPTGESRRRAMTKSVDMKRFTGYVTGAATICCNTAFQGETRCNDGDPRGRWERGRG
jgi:hypothetical protein